MTNKNGIFSKFVVLCFMLLVLGACSKSTSKKSRNNDNPPNLPGAPVGQPSNVSPVSCFLQTAFSSNIRSSQTETIRYSCEHVRGLNLQYECFSGRGDNLTKEPCDSNDSHVVKNLQSGLYSFYVVATDPNGDNDRSNEVRWENDLDSPVAEMVSSTVLSREATLYFTGKDTYPVSSALSYFCKLSGYYNNTWFPCSSPFVQQGLQPSTSYNFQVKARDRAGLESAPLSLALRTLPANPVHGCQITSAIPVHTNAPTQALTFICHNPYGAISRVQCRENNGFWKDCTGGDTSHTIIHPKFDGIIEFQVRYLDSYYQPSPSGNASWILDLTPPTVNITHTSTQSLQPSFSFTASDGPGSGIDSVLCKLQRGSVEVVDWENCSSPHSYLSGVRPAESHTFTVKAKDKIGQESSKSFTWISNPGVGPTCTITTTFPQAWRKNSSERIQYQCQSPVEITKRECRLNSSAWGPCNQINEHLVGGLQSGTQYEFRVRAEDSYGNVGEPSAPLVWSVDLNPPLIQIQEVENRNPIAVLRFNVMDIGGSGLDRVECKLDGVHDWISNCTSPRTYTNLVLNQGYTFRVRATDKAGHSAPEAFKTWTSIKQYLGPICTISPSSFPEWTRQPSQNFTFHCTDAQKLARIECGLSGQPWQNCGASKTITVPLSGTYTLQARGVDTDNKIGPVDSVTWKVDLIAPTVQVTGLSFVGTQSIVTFAATDAGGSGIAKTECRLNQQTEWKDCTSPAAFDKGTTAGGTFEFQVKSTDRAGNTSPTQSHTWTNGGWTAWSPCQAACGQSGTKTRSCTQPTPQNGGLSCAGNATESCINQCVAENGGWGPWSPCSAACGGGTQSRTCVQPSPQYAGSTCTAQQTQSQSCNTQPCCVKPVTFHPENGRDAFKDPVSTAAECRQRGVNHFHLCVQAVATNPQLCCGAGVSSSTGVLGRRNPNDCELLCYCK